jgi:tetratricopeptide (TPR) repeat protein
VPTPEGFIDPYGGDVEERSAGCFVYGVIGAVVLLISVAVVLLAGAAGWTEGQRLAAGNATATRSAEIGGQLSLIANDAAAGNLSMLDIRLRYLQTEVPGLPQLGELVMTATALYANSLPTATPTPTPTATLDPSAQVTPTAQVQPTIDPNADVYAALSQRLERAKASISLAQWPEAIDELDIILNTDAQYEVASVRSLMSQALNSYAAQLYRNGDLAEAIIYTDWAEQYGPLRDGLNYERYIATLYLNASAAVGTTDSQTAIRNLREIYNVNPNYMNGQVARLLAQSYAAFGDALLVSAPCDAVFQYNSALSLFNDGSWAAKRNTAQNYCEFGTPTPEGFVPTPFDPAQPPPAGQQ